jgi:hypothetical protein
MNVIKLTSLLSITSLLLVSCSKETQSSHSAVNEVVAKSEIVDSNKIYSLWEKLTSEDQGNLALSEFLAKSVYQENKNYIEKNVKTLSLEEIQVLLKQIERNSKSTKNDLIFYGSNYKNDQAFLDKTILLSGTGISSAVSFENQFLLNTFAKVKTDLLKNILTVYDQRIAENSAEIADYVLKEINDTNPELKDKIEKTLKENPSNLKDIISKSLTSLKTVDSLFKNSNLNNDEQLTTAAIGIISFQVYNKIKDKKTFQEILKGYAVVKDIEKKAKEVKSLLAGINSYQKEMRQDWEGFGKAMKGLSKDSAELVNKGSSYDPQINGKKIQSFMYETIFKGGAKNGETNPSILSTQISLNQNFVTAIDKAQKLNNNLYTILDSTQKIADLLKIELPAGVKKVMATAQKANAIFSTVNTAIQGLKSGGVIGALSALSSGPAMGLLGLNSDPDAEFKGEVLAQFGVMNQKLDEVIDLQKQTIKIQLETMSMIKNMALMIDDYHRQEMDLLSDVKDISLTNLEISKIALNRNLRACERLLNFQLNSNPELAMYEFAAYEDMRTLDLDIQKIKNSLNSFSDIYKMINSTEAHGWENCQEGLNEAFGIINLSENPIRSIYSSNENENLFRFQREKYKPLYKLLSSSTKPSVLFHLPVTDFTSLFQKYIYLKNEDSSSANNYSMEDFISTRALERYTAQLLVFYPFVDLDKDEWKSGLENVLELSLKGQTTEKNSRAYYLLRNNLSLIQTAIAEEAILSGELVFDQLLSKKADIFQDNITASSELAYAVVTNRLLVKNFFKYMLFTNMSANPNSFNIQAYNDAFEAKDLVKVAAFFGNENIQKNIALDETNNIVLKLKVNNQDQTYQIPSPLELQDNHIVYSENMYRLLELQKRVMDALVKVAPNNFSDFQKEKLARMMIYL